MTAHHVAGSRFGYPVNCDSVLFVDAALDPKQLIVSDHPYQPRPLYFVVPAAVGAVAGEGIVFKSYHAINIATLALSVWLLGPMVDGQQPWCLLVVPLFLLNDIVKAFVWTPHFQLLNIAVPVIGMWLLRTVSTDRGLRWALYGLATGLGILA